MAFRRYRKKLVEVKAVQFTEETKDQVFNDLTGRYAADFEDGKPVLRVETAHGEEAVVRLGDWIVKEKQQGAYYPVKPDIFEQAYEPVEVER